jgi:hypothetical protein
MSIQIESGDELEQLRTRLRKMTDDELIRFGKALRANISETGLVLNRPIVGKRHHVFGFCLFLSF